MANRIHIDTPSGVVEIEGEKDFVEGMLSKLFPLIEKVGFGSGAHQAGDSAASDLAKSDLDSESEGQNSEKGRAKRRRVASTPKGQSCADRILSLKSEGFFKSHRTSKEILEGLKSKGWTHKPNQIAASTLDLFRRSEIQRTKTGNGPWMFYWDRN
jgi:hypothetical protein